MLYSSILIFFIVTTTCHVTEASVFGWIWSKNKDETTVLVADGVPLISIPYESMTDDEKFLQEAAKFTEIQVSSPLETCQHKVIMKIKTSCAAMTEEDLAKLSVNLLNCQSAVEDRKIYPCTEEMSLKQCTIEMDADMWNAYHLMSNRARAVCYSVRNTQFRALTELTVNKLMQTAHTQIKTLSSLKEGQDRLEEQTVEALSSLSKGNEALLQQQKHLKDAQASAYNLVTTNLRELNNEKALIRAGHAELAAMANDIRKKLEEANQNLAEQAMERGKNHKEVLQDLMNIQEQAQLIWNKIENSTNKLFAQHEQALQQYEQTLQRLAQINNTIQYIWTVTNTMRTEMDDKLTWLTNYIGDTGEQMQRIYRTALHVTYLLFAMVTAAFLQVPLVTRICILCIVPLNLVSYLKHGTEACLDFLSMTVLISLITMMYFLMLGIQQIFGPKSKVRAEQVEMINQNGYMNGRAQNYESNSYINNQQSKIPNITTLYMKLKKTVQEIFFSVRRQTYQWIQKCNTLVQSAIAWGKQTCSQREELSCSYISSKRNHEDVVRKFSHDYSALSEDLTDAEYSRTKDQMNDSIDDLDNLTEASDLRLRSRRNGSSFPKTYMRQSSPARSTTSSHMSSKEVCRAITKKGSRCFFAATNGQNYCHIHSP